MKRSILSATALCLAMISMAQTDSTTAEKTDTIRIGGMIIIKRTDKNKKVSITKQKKNPNISTNWWVPDIGFTNYTDNTNYATAQQTGFISPAIGNKDNLKLRTGKSVNVNIWIFMQKVNLAKHYVNFKYALGLELNSYRFEDEQVRFSKNPTFISKDASLGKGTKNKLAADYVTIPAMLNFNFTPGSKRDFGFSAGMSVGYLYSARQKIKDDGDKTKLHSNFNLNKWKLSYIAELSLGSIKLYGSMATKSMWEKGLDQTPYNVGIRLSHF